MLSPSENQNRKHENFSGSRPRFNIWLFLVISFICSGFVFINGDRFPGGTYTVYADFQSVVGMSEGAKIEIAGIKIGVVDGISLTSDDMARVEMRIRKDIVLPDDSIISVRTRGLMGNKVLTISRGGSPNIVPPGGVLQETESGVDLEAVIGRLIYGSI
ncbi:MAG: MlaD family protein [Nitrospinales bacterium]